MKIKRLCTSSMYRAIYKVLDFLVPHKNICLVYSSNSVAYQNLPVLQKALLSKKELLGKVIELKPTDSFLKHLYYFTKSRIIVLDQANNYLSKIKLSPKTICVQCWHGAGLYKKVGFDAVRSNFNYEEEIKRISRIHGNIDYFIVSDPKLVDKYAEIFNLDKNKVLPLGLVRTDDLLARNRNFDLEEFYALYPNAKGKKICLYAPTFRTQNKNRVHEFTLNMQEMTEELSKEWILLLKNHPTVQDQNSICGWINVSNLNSNFLLSITDLLITDYSSIIFDYSLLNKHLALMVPDQNKYSQNERNLYKKPQELIGENNVFTNTTILISSIKEGSLSMSNIAKNYMSACNGTSCSCVTDFLINKLKGRNK